MPLDAVPALDALAVTRHSWHLLAAHVVAEERFRRVGHSGLEPTPTGFRTPPDEPVGVEVERDRLLVRRGDEVAGRAITTDGDDVAGRAITTDGDDVAGRPITTLGDAQAWVLGEVGYPRWGEQPGLHDPPAAIGPDTPLPIEPAVAGWLGRWFHLGSEVLGELVADPASTDAGVPTLWPEHFDVGIELLEGDRRASYGVSPGDATIAEPYAYVAVWHPGRVVGDPWWDATALTGVTLTAAQLATAEDAHAQLLGWFRAARDRLLTA